MLELYNCEKILKKLHLKILKLYTTMLDNLVFNSGNFILQCWEINI